jgi:hypothetical protein
MCHPAISEKNMAESFHYPRIKMPFLTVEDTIVDTLYLWWKPFILKEATKISTGLELDQIRFQSKFVRNAHIHK